MVDSAHVSGPPQKSVMSYVRTYTNHFQDQSGFKAQYICVSCVDIIWLIVGQPHNLRRNSLTCHFTTIGQGPCNLR